MIWPARGTVSLGLSRRKRFRLWRQRWTGGAGLWLAGHGCGRLAQRLGLLKPYDLSAGATIFVEMPHPFENRFPRAGGQP